MFNDTHILIFIDTDELGNITEFFAGSRIIPDKQYDYFFFKDAIDVEVEGLQQNYEVVNDQLVRKEA
jgi:hypothetical protein